MRLIHAIFSYQQNSNSDPTGVRHSYAGEITTYPRPPLALVSICRQLHAWRPIGHTQSGGNGLRPEDPGMSLAGGVTCVSRPVGVTLRALGAGLLHEGAFPRMPTNGSRLAVTPSTGAVRSPSSSFPPGNLQCASSLGSGRSPSAQRPKQLHPPVQAGSSRGGSALRAPQAARISFSSLIASAANARMPSASFSVAMASSFRA